MLCKQECHVWACPHLFCECHVFVGNGVAVRHTTAQDVWLTHDSWSSWNDQHVPWVHVGLLNSPYKCTVLSFSPQSNIQLWGNWLIEIPLAWAALCGGRGWVARGNEMKNEMTKKGVEDQYGRVLAVHLDNGHWNHNCCCGAKWTGSKSASLSNPFEALFQC